MAGASPNKTYVKITRDGMEAYLYLTIPEEGVTYTKENVYDILHSNNVCYGIDDRMIDSILQREVFGEEVKVANGRVPTDGKDGFYEYYFNLSPPEKPAIKEDGSVDYWSVFAVQTVAEGDIIAVYKPAAAGKPGKTVTGKEIEGKRGKELMPLRGKGFECKEDQVTYIALVDGKIEFKNNRIVITNMLEFFGDIDFNNGRIDFKGDVVIHGNVESGSQISSGGSVTIDGNVEATTIKAKKDVILRNGMQGGGKALIEAGGNIFAKFIEGTTVDAKGDIQADVLMNSKVHADGSIVLSGKKAVIIGGKTSAGRAIEVVNAGNQAEIKTFLSVGVDDDTHDRVRKLKAGIEQVDKLLNKIDMQTKEISLNINSLPKYAKEKTKEKAIELLRYKIKCNSDKAEFKKELEEIEGKVTNSKEASITVSKYAYPGVTIKVNSASITLEEKQLSMIYRYKGGTIEQTDIFSQSVS